MNRKIKDRFEGGATTSRMIGILGKMQDDVTNLTFVAVELLALLVFPSQWNLVRECGIFSRMQVFM